MPVLAPARAMRGLREDNELAVAIWKLSVEFEQVVIGRVAVKLTSQHKHRCQHLFRVDNWQVCSHVDIGSLGLIAEVQFGSDNCIGYRRKT